jgi:hypothetical protein
LPKQCIDPARNTCEEMLHPQLQYPFWWGDKIGGDTWRPSADIRNQVGEGDV